MPPTTDPQAVGPALRRVSADLRHFTRADDIRTMEKELLREMSRADARRIIMQAKVDAGYA